MKYKICPILSINSEKHESCIGMRCAFCNPSYEEHLCCTISGQPVRMPPPEELADNRFVRKLFVEQVELSRWTTEVNGERFSYEEKGYPENTCMKHWCITYEGGYVLHVRIWTQQKDWPLVIELSLQKDGNYVGHIPQYTKWNMEYKMSYNDMEFVVKIEDTPF